MGALKKFCDGDDRIIFVYEADGELIASSRAPDASKMGKPRAPLVVHASALTSDLLISRDLA